MYRLRTTLVALALAAALGAGALTGCDFTEGFDDDPNAALSAPPRLLLAGGQVGLIQLMEGDFARLAVIFTGQGVGGERQYARIQTGAVNQEDFNNTWNVAYSNTLRQLYLAKNGFEEENNLLGAGIARINMALAWGTMAALFGDIPFSEALQPERTLNPVFDPQPQVYAGIQQLLTEAINNLNATTTATQQNDIFGRTREQWIRIAWTLKARYALHTGDYANARLWAANGINAPSGDWVANHFGNPNADANIFWAFITRDRVGYLLANNAHAVRLLTPGDPISRNNAQTDESARRAFFYQGATASAVFNTSDGGAFGRNAPFPLVTYVENQLILAEAILKSGGATLDAVNALNSVRAVHRARFPTGRYDDYTVADFASRNALLREILTEKYVSLIGQIEAYNDIRRTRNFIGVPAIGAFPDGIPQRFLVPQNESNANLNAPGNPASGRPLPPVTERTPVNVAVNYTGV